VDTSLGVQKACQSGPSSNVSILGLENLKSGQKSVLSLSPSVNCDDAKQALWKVGNTVIGSGATIQAEIQGSGNYVVSVEIPVAASSASSSQNKMEAIGASPSILSIQQSVTVTNSGVMISGPQAGTADLSYQFSLTIPAGVQLSSAQWNFGDGSPLVSSLGPVTHAYSEGVYQIKVAITKADGTVENVQNQITLLPVPDGKFCALDQMQIVGPTDVPALRPVDYSVNLSTCLQGVVTSISWSFGDQSAVVSGATASHTYQNEGTFMISAQVSLNGTSVTLIREVTVSQNIETMPGPVPAPNPNACVGAGTTRVIDGDTSTQTRACGVDGTQALTYRAQLSQQCQLVGEGLEWVTVSTAQNLISTGACQGQSCSLPTESGTQILKNGESRTLYTSKAPAGACQDVQSVRTCNNGVLSGSDSATFLSCRSGCGDFGVDGTVQVGVVTGELTVPVTCQFGEQGITSIYNQISDRTCADGSIVTSNTRQGTVKTAGVCPVYSWVGTDQYTSCSADCGGQQSRIFECHDDKGAVAPAERCTSAQPVEQRVCDGNPAAVSKVVTSTKTEEAPSCGVCPKNQIGVIVKERTITTTSTTACVNHQVQTTDQSVAGAWTEESYCRDLTPHRCSQDSLDNDHAHARFDWMVKCQDKVPAIKEFLTVFNDVKYKSYGLDTPGRVLYPTFMITNPAKPWIAPTSKTAACDVPASAYIAGVCVSSCATPDQQILVDVANDKKLKYMPFIQALTQNVDRVATLQSNSSMSSKQLDSTKVDVWVTEMLDTDHDILVFTMKSGGQLKVTTNHPILNSKGMMQLSSEFKVGDSLVQLGGKLDQIVSIEKIVYHGKVYNVFVKSSAPQKNVVVTNGYLNGTAFYQNEGADAMNRDLFRDHLLKGAFPETKK
jgi:PKD repeat protein